MMPAPVRGVRAAFVFLTRVPVGGFPYSDDDFRWAPAHFPLVGLAVGAWGALVLVLAAPLGPVVAGILCVGALVAITGAFHEDGLADTADALGGHPERAKMFAILKDSRIGTYGACALGLALSLRIACVAELVRRGSPSVSGVVSAASIVALSQALSRSGPVCLMAALPYVTAQDAKSSAVTRAVRAPQVCAALGWVLAIACAGAAWLGTPPVLLAAWGAVALVTTALLGRWFLRRAGGYTGDFLGASQQTLDVVVLITALAMSTPV